MERGLYDQEVLKSRKKYGSNELKREGKTSFLKEYLATFGDPIIKILMVALFVNILFIFKTKSWYEPFGILIAVLLATFISALSERGSEAAFLKLQQEALKTKVRVRRQGETRLVLIDELVVGDIVLLSAGDGVPADGVIISGEIYCDQSALNGESREQRKHPKGGGDDLFSEKKLFRGSVVSSGEGVMRVTDVGSATYFGGIAKEVGEQTNPSPMKLRLAHLAKIISRIGYAAAVLVVLANLFNHIFIDNGFSMRAIMAYISNRPQFVADILNSITLGITVIVMAVPEGLPMMITVVLSFNMKKMLRDNVLVRKLIGIETSGSLNILFFDKTGTVTKGRLSVTDFIDGEGREHTAPSVKQLKIYEQLALNCRLNSSAELSRSGVVGGNSTERALAQFTKDFNTKDYERGYFLPFNSDNKFSVAEVSGRRHMFFIKGAPEKLIDCCNSALTADGGAVLINKGLLKQKLQLKAASGARLLALCQSPVKPDERRLSGLTLIGIIAIKDEIRPSAKRAIKTINEAGIKTVMITGDYKETAVNIAKSVGLIKDENECITGSELAAMSDDEVKSRIQNIGVIARALPSDKSRLVNLCQQMGLVTGMTGDGINDAPALKKADVGFVMGDGTEVAKAAGDIIILDNNINSISKAVLYGRTIFKSIRKFIIFQLSINFAAMIVSVIAPFLGCEAPITVVQMLWFNIIMDTLAGLAFAGEPPLDEYMKEPPKKIDEKILNRYMYSQVAYSGVFMSILLLQFLNMDFFKNLISPANYMTAFFALFVFLGLINSFNCRTHRINLFSHLKANKAFCAIITGIFIVQIFLIYFGGDVFRTHGLYPKELITVLLLSLSILPGDFLRKLIFRMFGRKGHV